MKASRSGRTAIGPATFQLTCLRVFAIAQITGRIGDPTPPEADLERLWKTGDPARPAGAVKTIVAPSGILPVEEVYEVVIVAEGSAQHCLELLGYHPDSPLYIIKIWQ